MMICKADFEELLPEVFQPGETCLARWENEGGRTRPIPHSGPTPGAAQMPRRDSPPAPDRTSDAFTTMPAAAAYGAAWVMLTTYDRMKRRDPALAKIGRR